MRPGETIAGRYELVRLARGGASGMVFEAQDRERASKVALKLIHTHRNDDAFRARVEREIEILKTLNHPNVVRYLDSGVADGTMIYLALEWLEGEDLADYCAKRTLPLGIALRLCRQIASALSAAHARGIVHRDVKPANVFLVNPETPTPEARLLDFGVAKQSEVAGVTQAGAILGTASYMAPEQAHHARKVDGRADVFSLGVVLFELIAGRLPWASHSELARLARILVEAAIPIAEICPELPSRVSSLVDAMLHVEAEKRVQDMERVVEELGDALEQLDADLLGRVYAPTVPLSAIESFGREDTKSIQASELRFGRSEVTPIFETTSVRTEPFGELRPSGSDKGGIPAARMEEGNSLSHVQLHGRGELIGRDAVLERLRNEVLRALTMRAPTCVLVVGAAGAGKTRIRTELQRRLKELPQKPTVLAGRAEEPVRAAPYRFLRRLLLLDARVFPDDPVEERRRKVSRLVPAPEVVSRAMRTTARGRADWLDRPSVVALLADGFDADAGESDARDSDRQVALSLLGSVLDVPFPSPFPLESIHGDPTIFGAELERTLDLVFAERAKSEALILLVDDAHLLDRKSAELLAGLVSEGRKGRLAVIAFAQPTIQSVEEPASVLAELSQVKLELPPLETDDAADLVRTLVPATIDPASLLRLVNASGGSPLQLEQVTRAVTEARVLEPQRDGVFRLQTAAEAEGSELVPPTAAAAVRVRLRQLEQRLQKTLVAAAIFGDVFWTEGVAEVTDQSVEHTAEQLDRLLLADLVRRRPTPRYRGVTELEFAHSVIRRVVLSKIRPGTRQGLEKRAAAYLESRGEADAATLAGHYLRAGVPEMGVPLLCEAARLCLSLGAFEDAMVLAEEGLEALSEAGPLEATSAELLETLAESAAHLGRAADADQALMRLLELPIPDLRRASALLSRARSAVRMESYADARTHARAAVELYAKVEAPLERAEAEVVRARADEAMAASRDALRGYLGVKTRAELLGARALLGQAVRGLARIGLASGDLRSAEARFQEALVHARASRDIEGVFESTLGLAEVSARTGGLDEARKRLDGADRLARRPEHDGRAAVRRALLLAEQGSIEVSQARLREVWATAVSPGVGSVSLLHAVFVGLGHEDAQPPVDLIPAVRESHTRLSSAHPALALPMQMALALLLAESGEAQEAGTTMEAARLRFARDGTMVEIEAARFLLARHRVLECSKARAEEQLSALREVVEQIDLVGSRLERKTRGAFLERGLARTVLELATKRGLIVTRDELSGRLSM